MKSCIMTVCTADHYQWYIPLFIYSIHLSYPQSDVIIYVRGDVDAHINEILSKLNLKNRSQYLIISDYCTFYPYLPSTTNALRFTMKNMPQLKEYDYIFITDADFVFFNTIPGIFDWHKQQMDKHGWCFFGHHGPNQKGCPFPGGWVGDKERIAGGAFMVTPEWISKTKDAREAHADLLKHNLEGLYREEDEVVLCKILKESGLPVPKDKFFPVDIRSVHLGDFKFVHRWTNLDKMNRRLTDINCRKYRMLQKDINWKTILSEIKDAKIQEILSNLDKHITMRKI